MFYETPRDTEVHKEDTTPVETEEEEFLDVTMRDTEVPEEDTSLVETEEEEYLVTHAARIVELEL